MYQRSGGASCSPEVPFGDWFRPNTGCACVQSVLQPHRRRGRTHPAHRRMGGLGPPLHPQASEGLGAHGALVAALQSCHLREQYGRFMRTKVRRTCRPVVAQQFGFTAVHQSMDRGALRRLFRRGTSWAIQCSSRASTSTSRSPSSGHSPWKNHFLSTTPQQGLRGNVAAVGGPEGLSDIGRCDL